MKAWRPKEQSQHPQTVCVCVLWDKAEGIGVKYHREEESRISQSVRGREMEKHKWVYGCVISVQGHIKV